MAMRTEEEYALWAADHDEAGASSEDGEEKIDLVNEKIERGLHILGATALEDKLEEGVPEAIEILHMAGIKLCKLPSRSVCSVPLLSICCADARTNQTGYSCNLLKHEMEGLGLCAAQIEIMLDYRRWGS